MGCARPISTLIGQFRAGTRPIDGHEDKAWDELTEMEQTEVLNEVPTRLHLQIRLSIGALGLARCSPMRRSLQRGVPNVAISRCSSVSFVSGRCASPHTGIVS